MTEEEKMMYEQYFNGKGLYSTELDFLVQLIRQTKEVSDTKYKVGNKLFDLVFLKFDALDDRYNITFEGALSNGDENRSISGVVRIDDIGYHVFTNVYRLCVPYLSDAEKEYTVHDHFIVTKNGFNHETMYISSAMQNDGRAKYVEQQFFFDREDYKMFQRRKIR